MGRILGIADSTADIDSGKIDGAVIGNVTPASGKFTTLAASGAATLQTVSATNLTATNVTANNAVTAATATVTGAAPTVSAGQLGIGSGTATTVGAAGAAAALPTAPVGYLIVNIGGVAQKIPYYN